MNEKLWARSVNGTTIFWLALFFVGLFVGVFCQPFVGALTDKINKRNLIIIFLITGIISGFMAGLLGVGGGIIIVPISYFVLLYLDYSSDYAMHIAIASSLGVICFTSISSIRTHLKLKNVNFKILRTWVPGIVLGSLAGSYSASIISGEVLVNIFICLAFLIALNMAFQRDPIIISQDIPKSKFINLIISSLIGFMSVLIGIGGGLSLIHI